MKKVEISEWCFDKDGEYPAIFNEKYTFAPFQIVLLRFYEVYEDVDTSKTPYVDIPVLISKIEYSEYLPECTVRMCNVWQSELCVGGSFEVKLIIHRYISPNKIEEKHINFFKDFENTERIFYMKDNVKIFPFSKKEEIIEKNIGLKIGDEYVVDVKLDINDNISFIKSTSKENALRFEKEDDFMSYIYINYSRDCLLMIKELLEKEECDINFVEL